MDRRKFLSLAAAGAGAALVGGELLSQRLARASVSVGPGPYGALLPADANGIQLPIGFTSRVVARSGQAVGGTGYTWHGTPDGGGCFADPGGGWLYVSNSEVGSGLGGASALRFGADASVVDAYRILGGTSRNCSGGPTPWGTWLSCEENGSGGRVWECDPATPSQGIRRTAMGACNHEAAVVDPASGRVYLTEDDPNGRLYRFTPSTAGDLSVGTLEAARVVAGSVSWVTTSASTPDRQTSTTPFNGGEGAWIHAGVLFFTTKGDNRVWELDLTTSTIAVLYEPSAAPGAPLSGVDNITAHPATGDLYVCEDGGNMEICLIGSVAGADQVAVFLRVTGQSGSELTGVAFSPDGSRMYFSSQRGTSGTGITYEVSGPFRTTIGPPSTTSTSSTTSSTTTSTSAPPTTSTTTTSTTSTSTTTSTTSTTSTTTTVPPVTSSVLVARGATWRYLDNGSNQGTTWRQRSFDDSSWKSGPAPLGYGDPVATRVSYGPSASRKYVTTYARRSFQATHRFSTMTVRVRRDDGVVVYVNGTQVARSNMPSGTIRYDTLASTSIDGTAETTYVSLPITAALVSGTNVIAVEIHQRSRSSSDLMFDLELIGTGDAGPLA
jgi:secreted PhoX family phosphatase